MLQVGNRPGGSHGRACWSLPGTKLQTHSEGALHSSHSSLFKPASFVAWSLCQSPTYSNFLAVEDLRPQVGPVRTCSAGSCNAFQSPYPTTWGLSQCVRLPLLATAHTVMHRVQKRWNKTIDLVGSNHSACSISSERLILLSD